MFNTVQSATEPNRLQFNNWADDSCCCCVFFIISNLFDLIYDFKLLLFCEFIAAAAGWKHYTQRVHQLKWLVLPKSG